MSDAITRLKEFVAKGDNANRKNPDARYYWPEDHDAVEPRGEMVPCCIMGCFLAEEGKPFTWLANRDGVASDYNKPQVMEMGYDEKDVAFFRAVQVRVDDLVTTWGEAIDKAEEEISQGGDGLMDQATFEHHSAAIVSLCAGMTYEQLSEVMEDICDLLTAEEEEAGEKEN